MPRHFIPSRTVAFVATLAVALSAPALAADGWRVLFNGRDLTGWKPNVYPDSWSVVDGAIRARATKESSHLFFVGDRAEGFERFKDFELEVVARSEPNSNGGIFIHTDHATQSAALRLAKGYEIQLNSSDREKRKTGSLYAVVDLPTSPVDETKWFTTLVTVRGKRISVQLDGRTVVDYTEPDNVPRPPERAGRRLDPAGGAIALQAHDPNSTFYFKSVRVRPLFQKMSYHDTPAQPLPAMRYVDASARPGVRHTYRVVATVIEMNRNWLSRRPLVRPRASTGRRPRRCNAPSRWRSAGTLRRHRCRR